MQRDSGYSENVSFVEGVHEGVTTTLHFQGDEFITQKTWDAQPHLEYARAARQATEGKRWGEGKLIGHIPPAMYAKIITARDRQHRKQLITEFFRDNPAFRMYDGYKP